MNTYNKSQVAAIARLVVLEKPTNADEFNKAFENAITTIDQTTRDFTAFIYPAP